MSPKKRTYLLIMGPAGPAAVFVTASSVWHQQKKACVGDFGFFLVIVLVLAGYYSVKSFLREYTYDATPKTSARSPNLQTTNHLLAYEAHLNK